MAYKSLVSLEAGVPKIPVLTNGKRTSSFVIEKFKLVNGSATIHIGLFVSLVILLKKLFFRKISNLTSAKEMAYRLALARMKLEAYGSDYVINMRIKLIKVTRFTIQAYVYGTAISRYPDTLPLYNTNEHYKPHHTIKKRNLLIAPVTPLVFAFMVLSLIARIHKVTEDLLINNISPEDEAIMWSYIKDAALENRAITPALKKVEEELNELLHKLPKSKASSRYNLQIYLIDEPYVDIVTYPSGNIAIYKNLLYKVKSEDVMTYLIAHEIAHLTNHDYIMDLKDRITNLVLILNLFGKDSLIGKLFISPSTFWSQRCTPEEEVRADEYALQTLNAIFGNIGGYYEFKREFVNNTDEYQYYLDRHPDNAMTIKETENFIEQSHFVNGPTREKLYLQSKLLPEKLSPSHSLNYDLVELFDKYRANIHSLMEQYQTYLANYHGLLELPNNVSKEELHYRYETTFQVQNFIQTFSENFFTDIKNIDKDIAAVLDKVRDENQKLSLLDLWTDDREKIVEQAKFYFARDKEYIGVEQAILNFLLKRHGTYEVSKSGIKFRSPAARDTYIQMLAEIERIVRERPPIPTQR